MLTKSGAIKSFWKDNNYVIRQEVKTAAKGPAVNDLTEMTEESLDTKSNMSYHNVQSTT